MTDEVSWLMKSGDAEKILGTSPGTLRKPQYNEYLLMVKNPAGSRYFVRAYVEAFANYKDKKQFSAALLKAFAESPEGKKLATSLRKHYHDMVGNTAEEGGIRTDHLMWLFGSERQVIIRWVTEGKLKALPKRGPNNERYYDHDSLMKRCPIEGPGSN